MRLRFSTKGFNDIVDITADVRKIVKESGVHDGIGLVFLAGSTGAITTIEYEGGVVSDLLRALDMLAPVNDEYAHNQKWGDGNGYAHVRSAIVKPSFSFPIEEGKPVLGKWQQIIFIDFDNKPRERELVVKNRPVCWPENQDRMRVISKKKIEELRKKLMEEKIDSAVFVCFEPSYDINIEYLTGMRIGRGDSTNCLIFSKGKMILAVSSLEYEQAAKVAEVDELIELGRKNRLGEILKRKIKAGSNVGINSYLMPYGISRIFPKVRFNNISNIMDNLRSVKEPKEIEILEKACGITNFGVKYLEENISTKLTEKDLAIGLENELRRRGAEEMSFRTIVTSGKRSSLIHPKPSFSERKIENGLGLVDFGIIYKGYCSDVTAPFAIGKLSAKQEKIVKVVESAYKWALENAKPNVPTWKLFGEVESIMKKEGFCLEHALGHGIGLEVHDSPFLGSKPTNQKALKKWKETLLQENMVLAIEPGVYVPGIGGFRIENDFLVMKNGVKKLTNSRPVRI